MSSEEEFDAVTRRKEHEFFDVKSLKNGTETLALLTGFHMEFSDEIESQMTVRQRYDLKVLQRRHEGLVLPKFNCHEIVKVRDGRYRLYGAPIAARR